MDMDKIGLIAQEIGFAYEDNFNDVEKRKKFDALFDKYLSPIDPGASLETYNAILKLGRKDPTEFDCLLKELREFSLIPG